MKLASTFLPYRKVGDGIGVAYGIHDLDGIIVHMSFYARDHSYVNLNQFSGQYTNTELNTVECWTTFHRADIYKHLSNAAVLHTHTLHTSSTHTIVPLLCENHYCVENDRPPK